MHKKSIRNLKRPSSVFWHGDVNTVKIDTSRPIAHFEGMCLELFTRKSSSSFNPCPETSSKLKLAKRLERLKQSKQASQLSQKPNASQNSGNESKWGTCDCQALRGAADGLIKMQRRSNRLIWSIPKVETTWTEFNLRLHPVERNLNVAHSENLPRGKLVFSSVLDLDTVNLWGTV